MSKRATNPIDIWRIEGNQKTAKKDYLAVEEPLEIKLSYGLVEARQQKSISITMRTPGCDFDLAIGFLFTEGIIQNQHQISSIAFEQHWNPTMQDNVVLVHLTEEVSLDLKSLERHFYTSSSCGVCGKASIEAIHTQTQYSLVNQTLRFATENLHGLPASLRAQQSVFEDTGGLHAAALFDVNGKLHLIREDVGRHNAVDKLIGAALQEGLLPLSNFLILVSGRASFELVQKAMMAGIPMLAAVGAPSSLAIELAKEKNMSMIGFLRDQSFNIYSHPERIVVS